MKIFIVIVRVAVTKGWFSSNRLSFFCYLFLPSFLSSLFGKVRQSTKVSFYLFYVNKLIIIFLIFIYFVFLIFYRLVFFFNFTPHHLISFSFYFKFGSHSFNFYLVTFFFFFLSFVGFFF